MNILSCIDNFYSREYGGVRRRVDTPIQTMYCTETEPTEFVHKTWRAARKTKERTLGCQNMQLMI
jgi:hypothetical protein